ncbi:MAG: alpha-N-acetylglucosaminidase [Muribaculaceae bacterium]|nr:alpha-N-acetylglucosaminidase [Muribaculaceae bacterium]
MRIFLALFICILASVATAAPIDSLAARVTEGTSVGRIVFKEIPSKTDFFEISGSGNKVVIEGNNAVSMATGLNWYLKYVAGIHISWNNLTQPLPEVLPLPDKAIRRQASVPHRYYLNYCTFSYSMPFWDEDRWMKEIDWMALHGINMPLSLTGVEAVWRNLLRKLGYSDEEIGEFVSGPAFFAWWQMNNLEGWGGPLPAEWYDNQAELQKKIVARMKELGIDPVLPGYAGMVPRNIGDKLGYKIDDPGKWCGFPRPAFLSTADEHFDTIADLYYKELTDLFGTSAYYSMDPFHEGGSTAGVNLPEAGAKLMAAMKRANPQSKWVIQSWQANPRPAMIDTLTAGDLLILDLYSDKDRKWRRTEGYGKHDWLYCMLLNFGGNVGLHGRIDTLVNDFYDARTGAANAHLSGVGSTPEGIENNPVMFELVYELPWREERFDTRSWLTDYLKGRYGLDSLPDDVAAGWNALAATVYNMPVDYNGQGTVESLFCARPAWDVRSASTWGSSKLFYSPDSTALAAAAMAAHTGNDNYSYDSADIQRQANADRGNALLRGMAAAREAGDSAAMIAMSNEFLNLILAQDSLLSTQPDMCVDTWLDAAGALAGNDPAARELYRRNAAMLITVWGDSIAANSGGLHDYSHREWACLLRELYYPRWKAFFDSELRGAPKPDFYRMECDWVDRRSKE